MVEAAELVVARACVSAHCQRHRPVKYGVLQTLVRVISTCGIVGSTAAYVCVRVARLEVKSCILRGLRVQLEAEVVALVIGTYLYGLVVHVGVAERIFYSLRAARDVDVMIERVTRAAVNYVLPVVGGHVAVHVHILVVAEIVGVGRHVVRVFQRCQLILPLGVVVGREHVHGLGHLLPAVVGVVAHVHLAGLAALGRDEDYAVGASRTVDGGRRCVLEHGDVLDVGGRYVADALNGEAVHDEQRVVALRDRAAAAHAYLHVGVGRALGGGDVNAGHLTSQRLRHRRHGHCRQRLAADRSHGTSQVLAAHRAVTDDHEVVEVGGLVFHRDVHRTLAGRLNRLRLHADVRDLQRVVAGQLDGEVTVEVGHRGVVLRPLLEDGRADDGLPVGVLHVSFDCLRADTAHDEREQHYERNSKSF